jgi:hypothetical protein
MTPRLIPYTLFRRLVPGLIGGAAGLVGWWLGVLYVHWLHLDRTAKVPPRYGPEAEGALVLAIVAATVAVAQVQLQGRFERTPLRRRWLVSLTAALIVGSWTVFGAWLWHLGAGWLGMPQGSLALRWRIGPWLLAGAAVMNGMLLLRLGRHWIHDLQTRWQLSIIHPPPPPEGSTGMTTLLHIAAGPAAGGLAAVTWYSVGLWLDDLYYAAMAAAWVLGATTLTYGWSIPEHMYRGWLVVRRGARPGWRIPLDPSRPDLAERFVGSFPAGLDLHLPADDDVDLLHLSVLAPDHGAWAARGLTQQPVEVRRPLERIVLSFDRNLPAPLETSLQHEDRIVLGRRAELELVVISREGNP